MALPRRHGLPAGGDQVPNIKKALLCFCASRLAGEEESHALVVQCSSGASLLTPMYIVWPLLTSMAAHASCAWLADRGAPLNPDCLWTSVVAKREGSPRVRLPRNFSNKSPPDLGEGGGKFANILPRGVVCQFLGKIQQKAGKRPFCNKNTISCIKNTQTQ